MIAKGRLKYFDQTIKENGRIGNILGMCENSDREALGDTH